MIPRARTALALAAVVLIGGAGRAQSAQTRTDFSGTWTFVPPAMPARSAFLRNWTGDPVRITQDATTITIEYVSNARSHLPAKLIYNLDGTDRKNTDLNSLPASQERVCRAAFRGAQLALTTIVPRLDAAGAPDPVEITEVLSLESPDVLSVQITRRSKALTDGATARYRRR